MGYRPDSHGMFWQDLAPEKPGKVAAGPRSLPPIPETSWRMPEGFPDLRGQGMIAIDVETRDDELKSRGPGAMRDGYICGVSIGTEAGFRSYYPIRHEIGPNLPVHVVLGWLDEQLSRPGQPKVGANLLYDLEFLSIAGVKVEGPFYDVQVAEPLLNENKLTYSLESLAQQYLGEGKVEDQMRDWLERAFGKDHIKANIWRAPSAVVGPYAEGDVDLPLRIFAEQRKRLEAEDLWTVFMQETRLIPMLLAMRLRGVRVDIQAAEQLHEELKGRQAAALGELRGIAGREVDVWAAESVAKVFDAMGVEYPRTEKTGAPSFRKEWLKHHPSEAASKIMEVRRLDKFSGTFVQGYILDGHHKGRIHTQFHSLRSDENGTVSGRLSCAAGWTPVLTKHGLTPLQDVRVGDLVWTHKRRWRPVTATWVKGVEHMVDLHLSSGYILTCTKKHRILSAQGHWIRAGDINGVCEVVDGGRSQHPGPSHPAGPLHNSRDAAARVEVLQITKIEDRGSCEVFDITVAEDESYWSCGLFSHNSSTPNLQNIPIRDDELGPLIRAMFIPEPGEDMWDRDYSQIEYRLLANYAASTHIAGRPLPGSAEIVRRYTEDPDVDYHQILADMTGLSRKDAKNVNFGMVYGQGVDLLCKNLGLDRAAGMELLERYHKQAPFIRPLSRRVSARAASTGKIRMLFGRTRHFNAWEHKGKIYDEPGPGRKRAFTHAALNALLQGGAAGIMKQAMVDIWESGVCDVLGAPHLTVHDELVGSAPRTAQAREALLEVNRLMESCVKLLVPLKADGGIGRNWAEAK